MVTKPHGTCIPTLSDLSCLRCSLNPPSRDFEGSIFFIPGTSGQKISEKVKPLGHETIIAKIFPNGFIGTDLSGILQERQIEKLVITGMMTFMCVDATARVAKDMGFHCTLVHDATAVRVLEFNGKSVTADQVKTSFLSVLSMICDNVTKCEYFLNANA